MSVAICNAISAKECPATEQNSLPESYRIDRISKGNPVGMPCPHFKMTRQAIKNSLDDEIRIINWTH